MNSMICASPARLVRAVGRLAAAVALSAAVLAAVAQFPLLGAQAQASDTNVTAKGSGQRIKLGLTLTSAGRAPGQTELFARGPHDGPGTFETGDPNLEIERANSIEATLRVRDTHLQIEGALWMTKFDNYIYGQLTGNRCDETGDCANPPGGDLRQLNYGQQDARFWGALFPTK